eukprot:12927976-Prorocentrum_lima.AAC.1
MPSLPMKHASCCLEGPADCPPANVSAVSTGTPVPVCGDGEVEIDLPLPFSRSPGVDRLGVGGCTDGNLDIWVLVPCVY